MFDEAKQYYAPNHRRIELSNLYEASQKADDLVHYVRAGGGFVQKLSVHDFYEDFTRVSHEQIRKLQSEFAPKVFSLGDDHATISGYTNDQRWNGWEMPFFTRNTINDATSEGGFLFAKGMNRVAVFVYLSETEDFLEISPYDGGEFEGPINISRVAQIATTSTDPKGDFKEIGLSAYTCPKIEVTLPSGEKSKAYNIGSGWTWEASTDVQLTDQPSI